MIKRILIFLFSLIFSASFAQWDSVKGGVRTNSTSYYGVAAEIIYNGDLYVGGMFDTVDHMPASGLAQWDGVNWNVFSKLNITEKGEVVFAFANYNGNLVIGGSIDSVGGISVADIAEWNGTTWSKLGQGISGGWVDAMAVYNGNLYVGGTFTQTGSLYASNIAMWNGSSWSLVGNGVFNKGAGIHKI